MCYKVIHDHSVDEATRVKRCKALLVLAKVYLSRAGTTEAGLGDIKARLAQQMNAASAAHENNSSNTSNNGETKGPADGAAGSTGGAAFASPGGAGGAGAKAAGSEYTSFDSKPSYSADTTLD